jgi:hypothetical protein
MVLNKDKLSFYDVKLKTKFVPKEYAVKVRANRRFGVAKNPKSGVMCWRVLGMKK